MKSMRKLFLLTAITSFLVFATAQAQQPSSVLEKIASCGPLYIEDLLKDRKYCLVKEECTLETPEYGLTKKVEINYS